MTTFALLSDLHLEAGDQDLHMPPADVLLLAGDIVPLYSVSLIEQMPESYVSKRIEKFFRAVSKAYPRVLWIPGNHEYYDEKITTAIRHAQKWLDAEQLTNIILADTIATDIGDVRFIGATLWTDYNRQDPMAMLHGSRSMNDFRYIENVISDCTIMFSPEQAYAIHAQHAAFITDELIRAQSEDIPAVVFTHHAPSTLSNTKYPHSQLTYSYCNTGLDHLFDYPGLKFWAHGHLHDKVDYSIYDCRIVSAPRGYVGSENTSRAKIETFVV